MSFTLHLTAQMFPLSDHYVVNGLAINPAFAGCNDALSATISYRDQWVGFKDSPKSCFLSVHTPLNNDRIGLGLLVENADQIAKPVRLSIKPEVEANIRI